MLNKTSHPEFRIEGFPNPIEDILYVRIVSGQKKAMRVQIVDELGKSYAQKELIISPGETIYSLSTKMLSSGAYYVRFSGGIYQSLKVFKK